MYGDTSFVIGCVKWVKTAENQLYLGYLDFIENQHLYFNCMKLLSIPNLFCKLSFLTSQKFIFFAVSFENMCNFNQKITTIWYHLNSKLMHIIFYCFNIFLFFYDFFSTAYIDYLPLRVQTFIFTKLDWQKTNWVEIVIN